MANTKPKQKNNPIVFRKNVSIGSADAEMDDEYLETCYVETDNVSTLLDSALPQRIIVGRTGSGKTALLKQIEKVRKNTSVFLTPEDFSFKYIADSTILRFFEAAGVNLNIFYLLLWRHIICVELIKKKYNISSQDKMKLFLSNLEAKIKRNEAKQKAFEYLEKWGDRFWETTEERIKGSTQRLESDFKSTSSVDAKIYNLGAEGVTRLSEEQRLEVVNIGKEVVKRIQIQKLTDVIDLLAEEIFDDPQEPYYVLIDKLDESNWAEDEFRFQIIRALIDTVKKFQKVENAKVIIALREDLLLRVLRETKDAGFQEEKIEPLYLRLYWHRDELKKILDLRIQRLFKRQYNKDRVTISDILPDVQREQEDALGYILSRTFMRPREAILFINFCLEQAVGKTALTFNDITQAEKTYSRKRLRSLCDEWGLDYPLLDIYINVLHALPSQFTFSDLSGLSSMNDILLDAASRDELKCNADQVCRISRQFIDGGEQNRNRVIKSLLCAFYQVGVVGVKLAETFPVEWSYNSQPLILSEQINDNTRFYIHPTFWYALSINPKKVK